MGHCLSRLSQTPVRLSFLFFYHSLFQSFLCLFVCHLKSLIPHTGPVGVGPRGACRARRSPCQAPPHQRHLNPAREVYSQPSPTRTQSCTTAFDGGPPSHQTWQGEKQISSMTLPPFLPPPPPPVFLFSPPSHKYSHILPCMH
jgi:hypothetical protein